MKPSGISIKYHKVLSRSVHSLNALLILFFMLQAQVYAQTSGLGSWNVFNLKYNQSETWSFFAEAQLRSLKFYDDFHYYEVKGGFNFKVHKSVKLSLGAGSYQTYREGGNFQTPKNNDEFRLWPQLILFQDINQVRVEQRYRAEMRWTSSGYKNRFRYRLGLSYPFGKNTKGFKPFQISLNNELFFTDNEPFFERNRSQVTLNYKLSKYATLQAGYLYQFDYKLTDEIGRDFLVVGYYIELFKHSGVKGANELELKDN